MMLEYNSGNKSVSFCLLIPCFCLLICISGNMERDLIEQATQLNIIE